MSELPETLTAGDAEFIRAESPEDFAHWTSSDAARPVSLLIEPADVPSDEVLAIAADVVAQFDDAVERALEFLRETLRASDLSADDLARLDDDSRFAEPEAVIWADGTWMLRFADCALDAASEYGVGVSFVGSAPQGVDLFDDAEEIELGDEHDHEH